MVTLRFSRSTTGTDPLTEVKELLNQAVQTTENDSQLIATGKMALRRLADRLVAPCTESSLAFDKLASGEPIAHRRLQPKCKR